MSNFKDAVAHQDLVEIAQKMKDRINEVMALVKLGEISIPMAANRMNMTPEEFTHTWEIFNK